MSKFLPEFKEMYMDVGQNVSIHLEMRGSGEPLLMVHGYPQNHLMWHKVAPELAKKYTVVLPDLRGYGDSSCPPSDPKHETYSKRVMARDLVVVMDKLGFDTFYLCGHDRGARVSQQLATDYPQKVKKCMLLDIIPTIELYETADMFFGTRYFHWFFLIQPQLPEEMIGRDPVAFLRTLAKFDTAPAIFTPEVVQEYYRTFSTPEAIHGSTEDYRAGATIDMEHQKADREAGRKIKCPLSVLWGEKGIMGRYDPIKVWEKYADNVTGGPVAGSGHFIPEAAPEAFLAAAKAFFA